MNIDDKKRIEEIETEIRASKYIGLENAKFLLAKLDEAHEALRKSAVRFDFLKGHYPCIGMNLAHVDGNCVHCFSLFSANEDRKALGEE